MALRWLLALSAALAACARHGQRMAREHTLLQAEASELKSAKGVPLPTRPDESQEAALLERTASRATDPALRAYAERAIPRVRQHLELAGRLAG